MLAQIKNIQCFIQSKIAPFRADLAIVLGSGLGDIADRCEVVAEVSYSELSEFGFPHSTVEGHKGRFIFGRWAGRNVVIMQGRVHYYEGWSSQQVVMPIRLLAAMGVESVILSNAAGGLNPDFNVGDLMIIDDHISFIPNPLIGANIDELGVRFPAMSAPYDSEYIEKSRYVATSLGIPVRVGTYIATTGPAYETRAEVNYFRMIGGDAVGMSTAPEVIAAVHAGMRVFAVSVITNIASSQVGATPPSHNEVVEAGVVAGRNLSALVERLAPMI